MSINIRYLPLTVPAPVEGQPNAVRSLQVRAVCDYAGRWTVDERGILVHATSIESLERELNRWRDPGVVRR